MKYRTELPAHAVAEIKANPSQAKFWEGWQAVGDAKLDATDAFSAVVAAETAYTNCRTEALTRQAPLVHGCGCGEHLEAIRAARHHYETQRGQVAKTIDKFKAGK